MAKRLGTYRVDSDLLDAAVAKAAERGETVTDLLVERLQAYIRGDEPGGIASVAPVAGPRVYTQPEAPAAYEEPAGKRPCRHPAASVDAGVCRECGEDVW